MNLDLTEEQRLLQSSARDFLSNECPKDKVRELEESREGYSPETWKKMGALGWLALPLPEKYGGIEGGFIDLVILLEEMGRNILPSPFFSTVVLGELPILEFAAEKQRDDYLPKIATGELILAWAQVEDSATYNPKGIMTKANSQNGEYLIEGNKLFVSDAHIANHLLVPCRSSKEGITVFLVDAKGGGIKVEVIPTTALDKQCKVVLDKVRVPRDSILGEIDQGEEIILWTLQRAAIAKCAEMLGGCQAVLEMTNSYAKERIQYRRPIADFQVIQHYLVDMWMMTETSRNIVYEVAWKLGEDLPCTREVSVAKAWVGEAFKFVTEKGVRIHGAIGTTREHDAGLYYRRAWAWDVMFGDAPFHQKIVANQLGL